MVIDKLENLNIISGEPLSTPFVFAVCFRNQEQKILRCLKSIIDNHINENFGIAIVDDASTDSSLTQIINYLQNKQINYVLVGNKLRKYYTRNLYNVNHLLVKQDSVIIEVDGDDYLSDKNVIKVLAPLYQRGISQTFGSFSVEPRPLSDWGLSLISNLKKNNFLNPWNADQCASWAPLRTYKRELFQAVPISYMLEKNSAEWLKMAQDICIHPMMMELAEGKVHFIEEVLYIYDISGPNHDYLEETKDEYIVSKLFKYRPGSSTKQIARSSFLKKLGKLI